MGGIKHFSSSSNDCCCKPTVNYEEFSPSPKINNYKILEYRHSANGLTVFITYKDVSNYEGKKILVYENCTLTDLLNQELIDPHFSDNKQMLSPIARFEPTNRGWSDACDYAAQL